MQKSNSQKQDEKLDSMLEDSFPSSDPLPAQMDILPDDEELTPSQKKAEQIESIESLHEKDPYAVIADMNIVLYRAIKERPGELPQYFVVSPAVKEKIHQWYMMQRTTTGDPIIMPVIGVHQVNTPYGKILLREDEKVEYIELEY